MALTGDSRLMPVSYVSGNTWSLSASVSDGAVGLVFECNSTDVMHWDPETRTLADVYTNLPTYSLSGNPCAALPSGAHVRGPGAAAPI